MAGFVESRLNKSVRLGADLARRARILYRAGAGHPIRARTPITDGRTAQNGLKESEQRFQAIFNSVSDGILVQDDATAGFIDVNARFCELFGYSREEMLQLAMADLSAADTASAGEDLAERFRQVAEQGVAAFEWRCKAKDGRQLWVEMSIRRAVFDGKAVLLSTARDITERKRSDAQAALMARYDQLTGLPNRGLFVEALVGCVGRAVAEGASLAILSLDLDHFRDVNDTLGHAVGDLLLQGVAQRLRRCVRTSDLVARVGGDEFAVILGADRSPPRPGALEERRAAPGGERVGTADATSGATRVARTLLRSIGKPFTIHGHVIRSSATIGIASWGDDAPNAETFLSRADVALHQAKHHSRGGCRVWKAAMEAQVRARVTMALELGEAIASNQLTLMYQPQVDIQSGRIVGLEALARWRHPTRGLLGAGEFIPAAEGNGLIAPLGQWVFREACRQTRQWLDAGLRPIPVAVNFSAMQFKLRRELIDDIAASVAEFGLSPNLLELELTESARMEASRDHDSLIMQLRARGHRIAIDDFGSGYSSLEYLLRYPADRIKIDRTFIADVGASREADAIVGMVLDLGRALDIEVVAEGVETAAQLRVLRSCGVRIVQGYYFARPLAADDLDGWLRTGRVDL